ncbi:unnamed protein product [Linum trigynum]|uniref:Uncharacterized protein n=1 Tax=Linum trigynum TaxID=586398 RepID=A0AAV2CBK0_9ROSI
MRIWIVGYDIGCALNLQLLYNQFRQLYGSHGEEDFSLPDLEQQRINEESRCTHLINNYKTSLELFFATMFVMRNVWIFDSKFRSINRASNVNVFCVSLLA